jgi:hypothetical protein
MTVFLGNVGIYVQVHTASQPRRPTSSHISSLRGVHTGYWFPFYLMMPFQLYMLCRREDDHKLWTDEGLEGTISTFPWKRPRQTTKIKTVKIAVTRRDSKWELSGHKCWVMPPHHSVSWPSMRERWRETTSLLLIVVYCKGDWHGLDIYVGPECTHLIFTWDLSVRTWYVNSSVNKAKWHLRKKQVSI